MVLRFLELYLKRIFLISGGLFLFWEAYQRFDWLTLGGAVFFTAWGVFSKGCVDGSCDITPKA
jgi:hypothetical protein